jgi:hypothetical protein
MMSRPKLDHEQLAAELENLSRGPFRRVLAKLLENAPSDESIAAQATKNPDRWAQTVALIARLGGYNEKLEVEGSLNLKVQQLSDSELLVLLAEYQGTLDNESNAPKLLATVDQRVSDGSGVPSPS